MLNSPNWPRDNRGAGEFERDVGVGLEAIGHEMAVYTHSALESAGQTARCLLGARTLEDVVLRPHAEFTRRGVEAF
jgi:hypothetical protein